MTELILKEYAGQYADVIIIKRDDGSVYVTFKMIEGYGYPKLELDELEGLFKKAKLMGEL